MSTEHLLRRTAKHSLFYIPSVVVPAIVGIVLIRIFTTVFSQAEFGYYNVTLSTLGLIKVFSVAWLSTSAVRFYAVFKNKNKEPIFFSTLLISSLVSAFFVTLVAFIIFILISHQIQPQLSSALRVAFLACIFISFFEVFIVIFRAALFPQRYSFYWMIYVIAKPITGLVIIFLFNIGVQGLFVGFFITSFCLDLLLVKKLGLIHFFKPGNISLPLIKQFASYGIPLAASNFSFWILSLSDRYLIEFFKGSAQVGLYSVSYAISEKTLQFAYMALMLAAYPIIVENWEKYGDRSTQKLISDLTKYYFFLFLPILVFLVVLPREVLLFFSDREFIQGAVVLPFIATGTFLYGLSQYVLKGFELYKQSFSITKIALTAGSINIISNIVLIPRLGFLGASISCMVSFLAYLILAILGARKLMPWLIPVRAVFSAIASAFGMGVYLYFASGWIDNIFFKLALLVPTSLILFLLLLWATGGFNRNDIGFVRSCFKSENPRQTPHD